MSRPRSKTITTWECPRCNYFYHSPIKGTLEVWHPCKATYPKLALCRQRKAT